MGIIGWVVLGLLAGALAKMLLPGDDPGGFIVTTIIGILGALIGGVVAKALGFGDPIDEFFDFSTWVAAIIGSIVLLLLYRAVSGRGRRRGRLAVYAPLDRSLWRRSGDRRHTGCFSATSWSCATRGCA